MVILPNMLCGTKKPALYNLILKMIGLTQLARYEERAQDWNTRTTKTTNTDHMVTTKGQQMSQFVTWPHCFHRSLAIVTLLQKKKQMLCLMLTLDALPGKGIHCKAVLEFQEEALNTPLWVQGKTKNSLICIIYVFLWIQSAVAHVLTSLLRKELEKVTSVSVHL